MLKYKDGGIEALIAERSSSGRPRSIPETVSAALEVELAKREGFKSYIEIQEWLKREHNLEVEYRTVHLRIPICRSATGVRMKAV
jgi:hypothetical protein